MNLNITLYGDNYKNQKCCSNQLQLVFELVNYFPTPIELCLYCAYYVCLVLLLSYKTR